jgi:hypothetical protein
MPALHFLQYNPHGELVAKASHQNFKKKEPTYAAPDNIPSLPAFLLSCMPSASAGAASTRKERSAEPGAKLAGKTGLLHERVILLRGGGGEDFADRNGFVAARGESAAADG